MRNEPLLGCRRAHNHGLWAHERSTSLRIPSVHPHEVATGNYLEDLVETNGFALANWNELMTTAEVAQLVRAPESTVRYWRHVGAGPKGFRLGRRVVYAKSDVHEWIRQQQAAQAS